MVQSSGLNDFQKMLDNVGQTSFISESDRKTALSAARSLCHRLERPMDTMLRVAWVEPSYVACLKIAMDIGVFRALHGGGAHSVESLSNITKTDPNLLGMWYPPTDMPYDPYDS